MANPVSRGVALVTKPAPTFSKFIVVKDTWKDNDASEMERLEDGNSETQLWEFVNPGIDAECTWVVKTGRNVAVKGDVVLATFAVGSTKKFVVADVNNERNGRKIKQSVKLEQRDSADASLTETDP
jgi:hypothetical protein